MKTAPIRILLAVLAAGIALCTVETWAVVGESALIVVGNETSYRGIDLDIGKLAVALCAIVLLTSALPPLTGVEVAVAVATIGLVLTIGVSWINIGNYAADEVFQAVEADVGPALGDAFDSAENREVLAETTERKSALHMPPRWS